jgi:hypothetical protein
LRDAGKKTIEEKLTRVSSAGIQCIPVYCTHHSHTPSFVLADAMSDPEREDVFYSVSLSPFILSRPPHQEKTCEDITPH